MCNFFYVVQTVLCHVCATLITVFKKNSFKDFLLFNIHDKLMHWTFVLTIFCLGTFVSQLILWCLYQFVYSWLSNDIYLLVLLCLLWEYRTCWPYVFCENQIPVLLLWLIYLFYFQCFTFYIFIPILWNWICCSSYISRSVV